VYYNHHLRLQYDDIRSWGYRMERVEMRCRCQGRLHTVIMTEGGRLSFPDHPKGFEADSVAEALGLGGCRCKEILEGWRSGLENHRLCDVPPPLREPLKMAIAVYIARRGRAWRMEQAGVGKPKKPFFVTNPSWRPPTLASGQERATRYYEKITRDFYGKVKDAFPGHNIVIRLDKDCAGVELSNYSYLSVGIPLDDAIRLKQSGLPMVYDNGVVVGLVGEGGAGQVVWMLQRDRPGGDIRAVLGEVDGGTGKLRVITAPPPAITYHRNVNVSHGY